MHKPKLFEYQQRGVDECREAFCEGHKRIIYQLPTGGGKTVIFVYMALTAVEAGRKVLVLVHGRELVKQAWEEFEKWSPGVAGQIIAGQPYQADKPIQVASLETLVARKMKLSADLVIFDECHRSLASTYLNVLGDEEDLKLIGFTATPVRSDHQPLNKLYTHMVRGPQASELIELGRLVECDSISPEEFCEGKLAEDPVTAWDKWARREDGTIRPGFAFFSAKKFAKAAVDKFNNLGISAVYLGDETSRSERSIIKQRFVMGDVDVICNVAVAIEGYNLPSAEVCLLACNCDHVGSYLQRIGRVLRKAEGKDRALLIDLPGVVWKHGLPTEDRVFKIDGIERQPGADDFSISQCQHCFATFPRGPSVCPECDEPIRLTRKQEILKREMKKRVGREPINPNASKEELLDFYQGLRRTRKIRGYKWGWVHIKFQEYCGMSVKQAELFV